MPLLTRPPARAATRVLARWRHLASWGLTAALALLAGAVTASVVGRAADAERSWGERRTVAVATVDLAPGRAVTADDLDRRELPLALLPPEVVDDPVGRVVTAPILAGEPVVATRVAGVGDDGVAALVPEGHAALAVALDAPTPPLRLGDRVDLLAPAGVGALAGGLAGPAITVARDAVVVDLGEAAVTVAVTGDDVDRVAAAILQGPVAVALR